MSSQPITPQAARARYPGMMPVEVSILRGYLQLHENDYDSWEFNFRVGQGNDPGPNFDQKYRDMGLAISKKRIDAVARKGDSITLIEVKNRFTLKDVGQIISYGVLWKSDYPTGPTPQLMALAASFDADALTVLQAHGISTYLQPVTPSLIPPRRIRGL